MSLTELPFNLQGNIFRSPMPFGDHDRSGETFHEFKQEKISVIVLLAEDEECEQKAGRNLRELYIQEGFHVIHFPIPDRGIPLKEDLEHFAQKTIKCAKKRHNIVIHCSAGIGRTGLFAAYLAKQVLDLPGEEAINWIRQYIDGAVETPEQIQLIIGDPNDEKEWVNRGSSFHYLERYEEALECYNKAIEINPNNENAWLMKGRSLNDLKRYEEALKCYNKIIEIDPDDKDTWWYLALSHSPNEKVLECYKKVIEINPDNKGAWWGNSLIYVDMRQYEEALVCYNKLIELNPDDRDVWWKKGLSLFNLERHEEALVCFNKTIEINPDDKNAGEHKVLSLLYLGRYEEALECYSKFLNIYPYVEYAWWDNRSSLFHNWVRDVEALKGFNKAIEINSNDKNAWINKGLFLRDIGSRGLYLDLDNLDALYDSGTDIHAIDPHKYTSSFRNRRYEEALKCLNKAIEIDPNDKYTRKVVEEIMRSERDRLSSGNIKK